ncbi:MAG: response regulator [Undibacterium sp.]|nr:response regulator [Opitutaceae bacterium]
MANGREAGSAFARETVDLVFTDLIMSARDGMELMNELRSTRPGLPVTAMLGGVRIPAAFYLDFARKAGGRRPCSKSRFPMKRCGRR